MEDSQAESPLEKLPLVGQDTVATENMIHGSGHAENASYHNICPDHDYGFFYSTKVAYSEKLELVDAADTEDDMQVADIEQQQCRDKGSMA